MYFSWVDDEALRAAGVPEPSQYADLGRQLGVFAQDVQAVLPEAVTSVGGNFLAVKYSYLIPLLFEGFHELARLMGLGGGATEGLLQTVEQLQRELRETRADLAEVRGALAALAADVQSRLN